jgi:hypothetical protein
MAKVLLPSGQIDEVANWNLFGVKRNCRKCLGSGFQGMNNITIDVAVDGKIKKQAVKLPLLCPCVPKAETAPVLVAGLEAAGDRPKEVIDGK